MVRRPSALATLQVAEAKQQFCFADSFLVSHAPCMKSLLPQLEPDLDDQSMAPLTDIVGRYWRICHDLCGQPISKKRPVAKLKAKAGSLGAATAEAPDGAAAAAATALPSLIVYGTVAAALAARRLDGAVGGQAWPIAAGVPPVPKKVSEGGRRSS